MSNNSTVLYQNKPGWLRLPATELSVLPAKRSRRLWINPITFIITVNALAIAAWALQVCGQGRPTLPEAKRRGPK